MKYVHAVACALSLLFPLTCLGAEDRFLAPPYGASASEIEDALKHCAGNQIQSNICKWSRFTEDESDMEAATAALEALRKDKSPEEAEVLRRSQEAFIQFRNATCAFDSAGGGSLAFGLLYSCRSAYTQRRTAALRMYLDCVQGGGCAVPFLLYIYENENRGR